MAVHHLLSLIHIYAVELTGAANGTVQGNLYELDYQQHFQHIRDAALLVGANRLIYDCLLYTSRCV